MTVKGTCSVTILTNKEIQAVWRYYLLRGSTMSAPAIDDKTVRPPTTGGTEWTAYEPAFSEGATNSLYFTDCMVFTDGSISYSEVSKSTSYEAAKEAYNKANNAQTSIDNLEIGGRNLFIDSQKMAGYLGSGATYGYLAPQNSINNEWTSSDIECESGDNFVLQVWRTVPKSVTSQPYWRAYQCYANDNSLVGGRPAWNDDATIDSNGVAYSVNVITIPEGASKFKFSARLYSDGFVKIEKGNKATDWTPAPEDVDAGISDAQSTADTAKSNAAAAQIAANTANTTANAARDKILSWCHENNQTLIDGAKIYTGSIDAESINVESLTADAVFIDEMETNLTRFKAVGENEYYETEITGEGIDFKYGTSEETAKTIAGISGDELQIKKTSVLDEMKIGKWSWKVNPNNSHLTLRWNGG